MQYRKLGKTGLKISEIGFGAWGIGGGLWRGGEDKQSLPALHKAADAGVNFFDTALAYGTGHSEQLIARFLQDRSEEIYVATKVPPENLKWPALPDVSINEVFPEKYVIESAEQSLRNLATDTIDLLQLHVWNDAWITEPDWYIAIKKLKEEGKIRFFGVSINDYQPENALHLIETGLVDTVQVIFNIFDPSPKDKLFPACLEKNVGVIVRVPFDEGALTGKIDRHATFFKKDFRSRYFRGDRKIQVEEHADGLKQFLGAGISTLSELSLRFCLSWDAVSTVIPGMRKAEHAQANCAVSDGNLLSEQQLRELEKHVWQKNFYL